jgi:hypothetical protein
VPEPLQPEPLLATLAEHDVRYVLIGGLAAVLHGSSALTNDADICPDRAVDNLERLARALRDIDARVRSDAEPDGLAFSVDAASLARVDLLNLTTKYGDFDFSFRPSGTEGYADLAARAVTFSIAGHAVPVAALGDIIRSKEAADRPKDRRTLPILYALQDEIAQQERDADD